MCVCWCVGVCSCDRVRCPEFIRWQSTKQAALRPVFWQLWLISRVSELHSCLKMSRFDRASLKEPRSKFTMKLSLDRVVPILTCCFFNMCFKHLEKKSRGDERIKRKNFSGSANHLWYYPARIIPLVIVLHGWKSIPKFYICTMTNLSDAPFAWPWLANSPGCQGITKQDYVSFDIVSNPYSRKSWILMGHKKERKKENMYFNPLEYCDQSHHMRKG